MILDWIKAKGLMLALAALAALLVAQTLRLHGEQVAHLELRETVARDAKARADAALKVERETATKERIHAGDTQEGADEFAQAAQARVDAARADLARVERLRVDAERRAATYRAMAQAGAAACGDLADRHRALDAHIVRGVAVVAGLRGDLARRDDEVKLLRGQIDADRALMDRGGD